MNTVSTLASIRADLHRRFGHELGSAEIDHVFERVVRDHRRTAIIEVFLPILVEREATEQISSIVLSNPLRQVKKRYEVLFVNRANGALAQTAAALLTARVGDQVRVRIARTHPENSSDRKLEVEAARRRLVLSGGDAVAPRVLEAPDITVYLGTGETRDLGGRREIVWDLPSTDGMSTEGVQALVNDLDERLDAIVALLDLRPASAAFAS